MGWGVCNEWVCLKWEGVFGMGGDWNKPQLLMKIVEFEKIVAIEYINMSGVMMQISPCWRLWPKV